MDNTINTVSTGLGTITTDTYDYINGLVSNPVVITTLVIILLVYMIIFASFDSSNVDVTSNVEGSSSIGKIGLILFMILLLINGFQYFFGYNIIASIKNLFTPNPELDVTVIDTETRADAIKAPVPEILLRKQVFNIPGNEYVYEDAKALCKAYGARLATYKEVEDTYQSGGEWCNYGWSDGQMALYPTQQKTYDALQKIEGHENDCGRPGVNGGYIANPKVKFGVNCYGYKPRMTSEEEEIMATRPLYPKTMKDIAMEERVNYWKDKLNEILVSPFNSGSWSRL